VEVCAPDQVGADRLGNAAGGKSGLEFFAMVVIRVVTLMLSFLVSVIHENYLALQAIKRFILPFCPNVRGHR
jgi:hypothetical protein